MTTIEEINVGDIRHFLKIRKEKSWTVLKFKIPSVSNPAQIADQIKSLTDSKTFYQKDTDIYGESYSGLSIQKNFIEELIEQADYDSVNASSYLHNYDHVTGRQIFFTEKGFLFDSSNPNIKEYVDFSQRPDLHQAWIKKAARKRSNTYFVLNDWASMFKDLLEVFASNGLLLYYGRLLKAQSGLKSWVHSDSDVRVHIPIYTNEDCVTEFYSPDLKLIGQYHMPVDEYFYLFNAYVQHKFYNNGKEDRLHGVFLITGDNLWKNKFSSYEELLDKFRSLNNLHDRP